MTTERLPGPVYLLAAMENALLEAKAAIEAGSLFGEAVIGVIELRDLAREGQALARRLRPSGSQDVEACREFRLGMALLEIRIDDFLRGQPEASPEEDQTRMDGITSIVNDLGDMNADLLTLIDAEAPKAKLH